MRRVFSSKFFNLRIVLGFILASAGTLLALIAFGLYSRTSALAQNANQDQRRDYIAPVIGNSALEDKIAPWVMERTANGQQAEFIVVLADQANLSRAATLPTKSEKSRYVHDALWNKSQATQGPLLQWLNARGIEHRSFYIVNGLWVKGSRQIAEALAARPDVARVEGNPQIQNLPQPLAALEADQQQAIEPGISYTHAPQVWALGFTGQGIVVAGADTGIRWTHNALKPHYRGWNGAIADHDYNWHDSVHSGGGDCGANSQTPCDDNGHGTHTIGTAIGDDGGTNQIGMAPGARWIGCRNMDQGNGTPATYIECMEFFLAPYPVNGTSAQGDPTKAPDITTNSWICPPSEGCSTDTLQAAVEAQRDAGIMMVVAAGNSGPNCSTVTDPPSLYDASYTVGALTTGTDTIASFSSRGPVTVDASNRLKPDITAPGTSTRSSYRTSDTAYASLSGTSMATPHIAGAMALLWSARPELRHDIAASRTALNDSAVHIQSASCGDAGPPNNVYGWGRVDILAAVGPTPTPTATPTPTPATIQVTVQTTPAGRAFSVDGANYSAAQTFSWTPGSTHTIATTTPQAGDTGVRYYFSSWSDAGAISHSVTPTKNTTYTAKFGTQYYLTMNAGTGGKVSPASAWKTSGSTISITATPSTGYSFSNWTGSGTGSYSGTDNPRSITMLGPTTETATFTAAPTPTPTATPTPTPGTIQVTVQTTPAGRAFSVDGASYSAAQTFSWASGSTHTIATTTLQAGDPGVRYYFSSWSDGGAISHSVAPTKNTTYTAKFGTQYYLTMSAGTGGKVSPASSWRTAGTSVSISATPSTGYSFSNWTGSGSGSYSGTDNPRSITIMGPITETAAFTHN